MNPIMDLDAVACFAAVARFGGFSAAARAIGIPRQLIHRRVSALEKNLELRLLERTTRRVRLTDAGSRLQVHAERILAEAQSASDTMRTAKARPSGTLRVTAPQLFGEEVLISVNNEFLRRWPETRIEASYSLSREDLIEEKFDLAIRAGRLADSGLRARKLGVPALVCCAARGFLPRGKRLRHPSELTDYPLLHYGTAPPKSIVSWRFKRKDDTIEVKLQPRMICSNTPSIREAARQGLGIARLPRLACAAAITAGELVDVLEGWHCPSEPLHAVFPSGSRASPTVDAYFKLLLDRLRDVDWMVPDRK